MTFSKYKFDLLHAAKHGYLINEDSFKCKDAPQVQEITKAIGNAFGNLKQLENFRETQKADRSITPARQAMRVAYYARKRLAEESTLLLELQAKIEKDVRKLEKQKADAFAPRHAANEVRNASVREQISSMDRSKRDEHVRLALYDNDAATIEAIATAPHSHQICPTFQYRECQKAFASNQMGKDNALLLTDLTNGFHALQNITARFEFDVTSEFIAPAMELEEKADQAAVSFYEGF